MLQDIFRKRTTINRALLRKMTYQDKASYDSTPPCTTTLPDQKLYENFQKFSEMNHTVILHGKFDSQLTFEKHQVISHVATTLPDQKYYVDEGEEMDKSVFICVYIYTYICTYVYTYVFIYVYAQICYTLPDQKI